MTIAVLADEALKAEFNPRRFPEDVEVIYADSMRALTAVEADVYFDLQFNHDPERTRHLQRLLPKPVVINSVIHTCAETDPAFIRINAWPTMLKRSVAEVACISGRERQVQQIFEQLRWDVQLVPDVPGMITPRVVSMIINEACFALGEGVSTQKEIDMAMQLGTNYPYGPFDWLQKIGRERILVLLRHLRGTSARYEIAPGLSAVEFS